MLLVLTLTTEQQWDPATTIVNVRPAEQQYQRVREREQQSRLPQPLADTAHRPQLKICFGSLRSRGFGGWNAATSYPLREQRSPMAPGNRLRGAGVEPVGPPLHECTTVVRETPPREHSSCDAAQSTIVLGREFLDELRIKACGPRGGNIVIPLRQQNRPPRVAPVTDSVKIEAHVWMLAVVFQGALPGIGGVR